MRLVRQLIRQSKREGGASAQAKKLEGPRVQTKEAELIEKRVGCEKQESRPSSVAFARARPHSGLGPGGMAVGTDRPRHSLIRVVKKKAPSLLSSGPVDSYSSVFKVRDS